MNVITLADNASDVARHSAANVEDAKKVAVVVTPTTSVTFTIQGSHDGVNWTDLEYLTEDSAVAAVKTAITAAGEKIVYVDGLDKRFYSHLAINVSAHTGAYSAELRVV